MRREESSANPEKRPDHDDANPDPGNGAASPGEPGYDGVTNVGDEGAERVTEDPGIQSDG